MDIESAILQIQYHWRTIEGIRPEAAPDEPTDKADPLPKVLTYEAVSTTDVAQMYSSAFAPQTGTIRSDLHLSRTELEKSVPLARKMVKAFLRKLMADPHLGGYLMITSPIRATFMSFDFGGITTVGYRVEIDYLSELAPS